MWTRKNEFCQDVSNSSNVSAVFLQNILWTLCTANFQNSFVFTVGQIQYHSQLRQKYTATFNGATNKDVVLQLFHSGLFETEKTYAV